MSILRYRRYLSLIQAAAQYLTPSQAAALYQPLVGTTNGSNAAAGNVGEFLSAQQLTNQPMTTSVTMNITSLSLPPGDWDVDGSAFLSSSTNVGLTYVASLSLTSASSPAAGAPGRSQLGLATANLGPFCIPTGRIRVNVSTTTTVYLTAIALFSSGTCGAQGTIQARRMR